MDKSLIKHQGFRSGSPAVDAVIIKKPSTSHPMSNPNTTDKTAKRSKTPWVVAIIALLLLAGGGKWALGEIQELKEQAKSGDHKVLVATSDPDVEADSKDTGKVKAAPDATDADLAALAALQKELDEKKAALESANKQLEQHKTLVSDQANTLKTQSDEITKRDQSIAGLQNAEATRLAAEKAKAEAKAKERVSAFEEESKDLKSIFIGWNEQRYPGYKVPMMKGKRNPDRHTPFSADFDPPIDLDPKGDWVVIDYRLPNGETVKAHAVKVGAGAKAMVKRK